MRLLSESAMKRLPDASTVTTCASSIIADVAGPPSPEKPPQEENWRGGQNGPAPATVLMTALDTFLIRLLV